MSLKDKKILLIAPVFFGYHEEIIAELIRKGASVDFLPDRPFKSVFLKALIRVARRFIVPVLNQHYEKRVLDFSCSHYDYVFVVNGEGLSEGILQYLKHLYMEAKFVLYMWDSFENKKSLERNLALFDSCYTFDKRDSIKFDIKYRPLFFGQGFSKKKDVNILYHLSFIGTAHSDRYRFVSKILSSLPKGLSSYSYFYLQAPWVFYLRKVIGSSYKDAAINDFKFVPLTKEVVYKVFDQSVAVFDIQHPNQQGLTMRSIESLGAEKKLITTNKSILNEDFYNPKNIYLVDRNSVEELPLSFFDEPYIPLAEKVYKKYSISGWVDEVLC